MNAKEKAKELLEKYMNAMPLPDGCSWCACDGQCKKKMQSAKECALISVDQILSNYCGSSTDGQDPHQEEIFCNYVFWRDVKSELQLF